ncbi:uncharacterized protein V2V93DRAFT_378538 [Kockiozyma suomiensis]|uniref:uncharacterized protein n=1 Tax=Kockiozyma suomiensis TaxID=1337062 RepID=UPI0033435396
MAPHDLRTLPYYVADPTPLPEGIPKVPEVGATSAPLLSVSYFIGARCQAYNDNFMLCRSQSKTPQKDCLYEGRRVTRCAISVLEDINKHCAETLKTHYTCLENANHELSKCRLEEAYLNKCVKTFLNLDKVLPGADGIPVHERNVKILD